MKLNKFFKFSLGVFFALPITLFYGNEILANNSSNRIEYALNNENLLACGGGGGGGGGSKPGELKSKKLTTKLNFKKRQLSKKAAAGEDTSALQAEINALEAEIRGLD